MTSPTNSVNDAPIWSTRVKLDRAEKHLQDLDAEISAFIARNPYRLFCDEDSEPAIKIYRIKVIEPIPSHWSAAIGDVIHNIRAALDCLATSLVWRAGHTSNSAVEDAYFPIRANAAGLGDRACSAFFKRIGADAEKFIRAIEPYKGGKGELLWILSKLDILDKHRALIPAGATFGQISINSNSPLLVCLTNISLLKTAMKCLEASSLKITSIPTQKFPSL